MDKRDWHFRKHRKDNYTKKRLRIQVQGLFLGVFPHWPVVSKYSIGTHLFTRTLASRCEEDVPLAQLESVLVYSSI